MSILRYVKSCVPTLLIPVLAALAACGDPNAPGFEAQLVTDTVTLVAPDASGPVTPDDAGSALDIGSSSAGFISVRRPERVSDAGQWDVALRRRGGDLVLVPPAALRLGGAQARAAITGVEGGFDDVREVSTRTTFAPDSVVVLRPSAVYLLRSRVVNCGLGGGNHFAKLEVLALNPVAGTAQLRVAANRRCSDPRLVADD